MKPNDLEKDEVVESTTDTAQIIVYNDEVNSFEHVIVSFIRILNHQLHQAEQCASIIHTKGKCSVKVGDYVSLIPQYMALLDAGLQAEII